MKHWAISAEAGHDGSLAMIKEGYVAGCVTKDMFAKALRAHKSAKDETNTPHREEAAKIGFGSWAKEGEMMRKRSNQTG